VFELYFSISILELHAKLPKTVEKYFELHVMRRSACEKIPSQTNSDEAQKATQGTGTGQKVFPSSFLDTQIDS